MSKNCWCKKSKWVMGEVRQRTELRPGSYPFSGFGNGSEKTEKERKIEPKRILQKIAREKKRVFEFYFCCLSLCFAPSKTDLYFGRNDEANKERLKRPV